MPIMPHVRVRRLLKAELGAAFELLCAAGRDYRFADKHTLLKIYENGLIYGVFEGTRLAGCAAECRAGADINICAAAMKTRLFSSDAPLVIPFNAAAACSADYCLLPVKSGAKYLASIFAEGYVLCAMRPLYELRPFYIFKKSDRVHTGECIKIKRTDTLSLSRALDCGMTGIALFEQYVCLKYE